MKENPELILEMENRLRAKYNLPLLEAKKEEKEEEG
jgi:recombination protein RecA